MTRVLLDISVAFGYMKRNILVLIKTLDYQKLKNGTCFLTQQHLNYMSSSRKQTFVYIAINITVYDCVMMALCFSDVPGMLLGVAWHANIIGFHCTN